MSRRAPLCRQLAQAAARLACLLMLMLLARPAAAAPADCPPLAQPPTAEQLHAGRREARDRGPLWRLRKDGRVSWLYGTLHVGRLAWAPPGPRVGQALQASDTLALEIDLADPATGPSLARGLARLQQREAGQALPAALRSDLDALARADCLDPAQLASQPLVLQAVTLTVLAGRREGLDPAYAQEVALGAVARAAGKPVVSLETAESQLALLAPDDAAQTETLLRRTVDQLRDGQARRLIAQLAALWERGDVAQLARYEAWCGCVEDAADRAQLQRMNDDRNPALAERIAALHEQGRQVFAAVGALHMTGAKALPALLQARGFEVERIVFAPP